jgi:hypothetical protein
MTEREWLACADPRPMLEFIRTSGVASDRKLRLLAVAGCRFFCGPAVVFGIAGQRAVEAAERYADGLASREELLQAAEAASELAWHDLSEVFGYQTRESWLEMVAARVADESAAVAVQVLSISTDELSYAEMTAAQAARLRDIFANPFRPASISPGCLTPQVVALAQAAYDYRDLPSGRLDPARLAVLADALEEAGCTQEDILGHLRDPGPHVRGCWVVDLLLGKG